MGGTVAALVKPSKMANRYIVTGDLGNSKKPMIQRVREA